MDMVKRWFLPNSEYPLGIPMSKLGECIEYLRNIIGNEWVKDEILSYKEWCHKYSIPLFWNIRHPNKSMLIPMFTIFEDWWCKTRKPKPPAAVIDLATIAGEISYFKPYWSSLKAGAGEKHIRSNMRHPETCRGMIFELATAFHYVRAGATLDLPPIVIPLVKSLPHLE